MSPRALLIGFALFTASGVACAQQMERTFSHASAVHAFAFSPDGARLATATKNDVVVWDIASGKRIASFAEPQAAGTSVSFMSGGKTLVASSRDSLTRWDLTANKLLSKTPGGFMLGKHGALKLDLAQPGQVIYDRKIQLWDLDKKQAVKTWLSPSTIAAFPTLSPDGERLVVLVPDGVWKAHVLDAATLAERFTFSLHAFSEAQSMTISADNRYLALGTTGDASVWDLRTGRLQCVLVQPQEGDGEADS